MREVLPAVRFTLRQLKNRSGFAAVAILTLALGIAASTVVFSVIYNVCCSPFLTAAPNALRPSAFRTSSAETGAVVGCITSMR